MKKILLIIMLTVANSSYAKNNTKIVPIKDFDDNGVMIKSVCYDKKLHTMAIWVRSVSIIQVMQNVDGKAVPVTCKR